jgi:hypothetical protein
VSLAVLDLSEPGRPQLLGVKRQLPHQQLIQDHSQGIDVRPRVDVQAGHLCLLRAHVLGRPDELALLGEQRPLGQAVIGRLGDPEIDDLGHRPVVLDDDQNVRWLEVPVDDALLMGVLDGLADGDEKPQALLSRELVPVAVVGDRDAPGELHHKIGPAGLGGSGIENLGDVGMVHDGQGLPLGLEPRHHLPGVHPELDDLEGDAAADRLDLLGQVDDSHPAAS